MSPRLPLLLAASLLASCAQPGSSAAGSDAPEFATDIPESIVTPDTVDTRLGTLRFRDGFPDDDTVEAVYDQLDFSRGVETFLTGMPAASMHAMREGILGHGPANTTALLFEELMDSRTLFLTPNTESVYGVLWLDLSDGPMVLETPPDVLGFIDDAWFRYVLDFGRVGPDRGKGGTFALLPPDYDGPEPEGMHVARSRTYGHWVIWRGFLKDGSPAPAVANVKEHLRVYPLGTPAAERPEMSFVNVSGKSFNTIHAMDRGFFDELDAVVQSEPTTDLEPEVLGVWASVGIRRGKPFAPDARMDGILTEAAAVGSATVRTLAYRPRDPETFFYEDSAWGTPFVGGSHEFIDGDVRLLDARGYFFFYATGITPAMAIRKVGAGSAYAVAFVDADDAPLDGGRTYRLQLPTGIPARDFWSIVLYDNQTRSMLQTDQQFPSLGSQAPDVVVNDDGSVDVYFGPEAPDGHAANWIQTMPGKGYSVILRLYGPEQSWFDKSWKPSEIESL